MNIEASDTAARRPRAPRAATPASKHPGRVRIEVSLGADGEDRHQFVGGDQGNIMLTRGKPVWVPAWVVEHLRLAVVGVTETDPNNPDRRITVYRQRFPFTVLDDPEGLVPATDSPADD